MNDDKYAKEPAITRHFERNESWFYRKFYNEDVRDSVTFGRWTIHLCGPWDYGAPLRFHINLRAKKGRENRFHFAIGLWPGHGFARPLYARSKGRWWSLSTPRIDAKNRAKFEQWKLENPDWLESRRRKLDNTE